MLIKYNISIVTNLLFGIWRICEYFSIFTINTTHQFVMHYRVRRYYGNYISKSYISKLAVVLIIKYDTVISG